MAVVLSFAVATLYVFTRGEDELDRWIREYIAQGRRDLERL